MARYLVALSLFAILAACRGGGSPDVPVTTVKRGVFISEMIEQGRLEAVNSIVITTPPVSFRYGALRIARIVEDGREVEAGDTIVVFDPSEVTRAIIQAEQQLTIAESEYEKLLATQRSEIEDLEADLELARITQEISKINLETSIYEPEATRTEIEIRYESASVAVNRAIEQIENRKLIHQEDLVQRAMTVRQLTASLEEARRTLNDLYVVSPARGIAIRRDNFTTGQKWNAGDQPFSGTALVELPDLSAMRATLAVNEVDVSKVAPGQRVEIRPDAFSDSLFTGTIESVANLARNRDARSSIKVFPVQVRLDAGRSGALLPGLTVSCRIIVSESPDMLYVPIESVFNVQGRDFVWLNDGPGFVRREIVTGEVNSNFVVVAEGLEEDDIIALTDPFAQTGEWTNN